MVANYILTIVVVLAALYFRSYLRKKGENLATKEDTAEITRKVEEVRAEYAENLHTLIHEKTLIREAVQRRHQLSMAALDRRLQAHQTAYFLWRQLSSEATKDDGFVFIQRCDTWWDKHCLYLSEEAGSAFREALHAAASVRELRSTGRDLSGYWDKIYQAGDVIRKAVQLPPLSRDVERRSLKSGTQ